MPVHIPACRALADRQAETWNQNYEMYLFRSEPTELNA